MICLKNSIKNNKYNFINECFRILKEDGSIIYNHKDRIKNGVQIAPYEWILKSNYYALNKK
jgi:hypothetical protein